MMSWEREKQIALMLSVTNLHWEGASYTDDNLGHVIVDPDEEGGLPHVHVVRHVNQLHIFLAANL